MECIGEGETCKWIVDSGGYSEEAEALYTHEINMNIYMRGCGLYGVTKMIEM